MKKKSERIKPIRKLAQHHEDHAANDLGQSQQRLQNCRTRLNELTGFRLEYTQQFNQAGQSGISGRQLNAFQQFMSTLDEAIRRQHQLIADAENHYQQQNRQWQDMHRRTQVLDKTIQRITAQENSAQQRREQREQDEIPRKPVKPGTRD